MSQGVDMVLALDPWAFGWDALVAIGTIGLAVATFVVAFKTWSVADKTGALAERTGEVADKTGQLAERTGELAAETARLGAIAEADVAAQFRPILLPARFEVSPFGGIGPGDLRQVWGWDDGNGFKLAIVNGGRGAAINVTATARDSDQTVTVQTAIGADLAPVNLRLPRPLPHQDGRETVIEITYASVTGERFVSVLSVQNPALADQFRWETHLSGVRRVDDDHQ